MADIYDRTAPGVVNVFDVTLRTTGVGGPQAVEQPEGNGTGFVWDTGESAALRGPGGAQVRVRRQALRCLDARRCA